MGKKMVFVVGASSGIGKAIYEHFKGAQQYSVIGAARRGPDYFIDMADLASIRHFPFDVDILVYCAGIMPLNEEKQERLILDVNFFNYTRLVNEMLTNLLAVKDANVISIASVSAYHPDPHQSIYAASKAAMIAWNKSMALRYINKIRFNSISPGFINTNLVPGETPKELINEIPMGYEAKPEVLLPVVDMILNTPYLTGQDIVVDGGLLLK